MDTDSAPGSPRRAATGAEDGIDFVDLIDDIDAVVWEADPASLDFIFVNRRAVELLGYERSEWYEPGFWASRLIYPPDRERAVATCTEAVAARRSHEIEYRAVTADGRVVWLRDRIRVVPGADGQVAALRGIMLDVTRQKQTEAQLERERSTLEVLAHEQEETLAALRDSEERYRTLASNAADAIITIDESDTIRFANPATAALFGWPLEEIVGEPITRLMPQKYHERHREGVDRVLRTGARRIPWNGIELEGLHRSGRTIPLWISFGESQQGGKHFFTGIIRDLTERYEADRALKESEKRFRDLAEHIPQVFWMATPRGEPIYTSPAYERIWGHPPIEGLDDWTASIHPDDRGIVARRYEQPPETRDLEYRIVRPDGAIRWILDRAYPIRDADGAVERVVGTAEDITDWKEARNRLKAAELHYRRLVETSPYAVYVCDAEGRFLELNSAAEEILGQPAAALLGRHFGEIVAPESQAEAGEAFERILGGDTSRFELELTVVRPSGESRLLSIAAMPVVAGDQRIGVHGIARDITHDRQRDAQRRLLESALGNLPDAVSISSGDGRLLYSNPAHAELLGYDPAHPPETVAEVFSDEHAAEQFAEIRAALQKDRRWSGRIRRKRADGTIALLSTTAFAITDGAMRAGFAVMRDASDEIAREQHLRRVERLASVGTLIGGVAHELNNPLTAVVGFAHLMLLDQRSDEDRETLETMAREAERAAKIVADLRLVARNTQQTGREALETVDLNDVVRHVLKVRRYSIDTSNIALDERLADDLPMVRGNRGQLEQVLVNLIVNAEQALARMTDRRRELTVRTRVSTTGVTLHVADNGPGIARDHLERIFDPFFTTKEPGEGTGLGLSLVHSIVTEHGGALRVESEPDQGAEFVLDLPTMKADAGDVATAPEPGGPASGVASLRILVVDDEAPIRLLLARAMRRRGHVVTEARDGAEALRFIDDPDAEFDVIVSDLRMPGLGGEQLLARLHGIRPGLARRVVFITGDSSAMDAGRSFEGRPVPVVMKPFHLDAVARLIEGFAPQDSRSSSG